MPEESQEDLSSNSRDLTFGNDKDFENKMEIVTDIKIELFILDFV